MTFEDAWFQSADGTRLHGWYVPNKDARAAVLFCHGNAGNITHRAEFSPCCTTEWACRVLIFDYRGYGRSEGKPNEAGRAGRRAGGPAWLAEREKIAEEQTWC